MNLGINLVVDGKIGNKTIEALNTVDSEKFFRKISQSAKKVLSQHRSEQI